MLFNPVSSKDQNSMGPTEASVLEQCEKSQKNLLPQMLVQNENDLLEKEK